MYKRRQVNCEGVCVRARACVCVCVCARVQRGHRVAVKPVAIHLFYYCLPLQVFLKYKLNFQGHALCAFRWGAAAHARVCVRVCVCLCACACVQRGHRVVVKPV